MPTVYGMPTIAVERAIQAPVARIFDAVANIEKLSKTSDDIESVEFLSDIRMGVGTRFREVRNHKGKQMVTELEVTEFENNSRARMVSDSHGTVWDTTFITVPTADGGTLRISMDARGNTLFARVMNVVMQPVFRRGLDKHIDAVKVYCERLESGDR